MRVFPFPATSRFDTARLLTITRGDRVARFTDWGTDITIGIDTWKAIPGAVVTAVEFRYDGDVSNCEIQLAAHSTGPILPGEMARGVFDGSLLLLELCDPADPTVGKSTILSGYLGPVSEDGNARVTIEGRGQLTKARAIITERYGPDCRADLGDDRCKIELYPPDIGRNQDYVQAKTGVVPGRDYKKVGDAWGRFRSISDSGRPTEYANVVYECTTAGTTAGSAPAYNNTPGATTNDGSAVFTARDAYVRDAVVNAILTTNTIELAALPDPRAVDGWYTLGTLIIRSGTYAGIAMPISNWVAAGNQVFFFFDNINAFLVGGEDVEIMVGCDKTEAACNLFDNNIRNRRAETFAPSQDLSMASA